MDVKELQKITDIGNKLIEVYDKIEGDGKEDLKHVLLDLAIVISNGSSSVLQNYILSDRHES